MEQKKYDIFISYRRDGGKYYARTIQQALKAHQYEVFLDFDELNDGKFDNLIRDAIKSASVFLLILSKGSLDRCVDKDDMVRKEILYANKFDGHIVPVNIDKEFESIPEKLPEELKNVVGAHQFSELQMGSNFDVTMEKLINNRIQPYVKRDDTKDGKEIHIEADVDCALYCFKELKKQLKAEQDNVVWLKPGRYKLKFISAEFPDVKDEKRYDLPSDKEVDFIEISLKDKVEQAREKRKAEAKELNGKGCEYYQQENFDDAVKCWRKAAEYGNADAQFHLGKMYQDGHGLEQSYEGAVKWYSVAAENGHVEAQGKLGICYFNGRGVEKNLSLAEKWLTSAAEQGNPEAQFYIGYMYDLGLGVNTDYSIAANWYQKSAEQGNMNAWLYLAYLNLTNTGVNRNVSKLKKECDTLEEKLINTDRDFLSNAAATGDVKALCILGVISFNEDNEDDGVKWLETAAQNGCDIAKIALAFVTIEDNPENALSLAKPFAIENNPLAQWLMAIYYHNRKEYHEAISWLMKAVIQEGMNLLYGAIGDCYEELQDYSEALKWYKIANEKGEDVEWELERVEKKIEEAKRQAELELKRKQEEEEARKKAEEDALHYANECLAKANDAFLMGMHLYEDEMYKEALNSYCRAAKIAHDYNDDIKWYRKEEEGERIKWKLKSIEQEINQAICQTKQEIKRKQEQEDARKKAEEEAKRRAEAIKIEARENYSKGEEFYRKGMYAEAVKWYRMAAEQGNANAQNNLGYMYRNGKGVQQSDEEAVKWYRMAAEQGHASAQNNLGWSYRIGKGVQQSDEVAVKWYRMAAEQGNANAQNNLGYMYQNGKGVPQSDDEAVKWFRKAAEQGNAFAQYNLGYMYQNGKGVPQSDDEAVKWYRKAAEQGDVDAQKALERIAEEEEAKHQKAEEDKNRIIAEAERKGKEALEKMVLNPIKINDKYGFVDEKGKLIIPNKWKYAGSFSEGLAAVKDDYSNYGYIDKTGKVVIPCKWHYARSFSEGLAAVEDWDFHYGYIDKIGKVVIPCKWRFANSFSEGLAAVGDNDFNHGYIDKTGKVVIPCKWGYACDFSEGLACVKTPLKFWNIVIGIDTTKGGYIDKTGKLVIPCKWRDARSFSEGLAMVKGTYWFGFIDNDYIDDMGKWGYIDKSGKLTIPYQWKDACSFNNDLASVKDSTNGIWYMIDKMGKSINNPNKRKFDFEKHDKIISGIFVSLASLGSILFMIWGWHEQSFLIGIVGVAFAIFVSFVLDLLIAFVSFLWKDRWFT